MRRDDDTGWWNPRVLAILAVVFFCGSAFGAAAMRFYLHQVMVPDGRTLVYNGHRLTRSQLDHDLDLRDDQRLQLDLILDDSAKFYQNLEEQRQDTAESIKQRITQLLDEKQRAHFDQLLHAPAK